MQNKMVNIRTAFLSLILIFPCTLAAREVLVADQKWREVGRASLSVLWFDIYDAQLWTLNGQFEGYEQPLSIRLSYKRDISKSDLLQETDKQLKRFINDDELRLIWLKRLNNIWPDIKKGDELIFETDAKQVGYFFFNQTFIGSIKDPQFSTSFPKIWLSPKGEYPKLASRLRGEQKTGDQ